MKTRRPTQQTTCPGCGYTWQTLAIGRSATCRPCGAQHYVPADHTAAVPLADRPHREVSCGHCGHTWATRRPPQSAVPCSQCGAGVWVSRTAPVVESPAEVRRQARAELAADRRAERAADRRRLAADRTPPAPRPHRPAPVSPAPAYTPQLGTLAALVADLAGRLAAPPAPPRPAPPRPAYTPPAPPPAAPPRRLAASVTVGDNPWSIGPDTAGILAAIGQRDYLTPVREGDCPFWVVARGALCGLAAPYRVRLTPTAYLPACTGHAWSIRHQCAQFGVPFSAFPGLGVQR